ncbi:MAG: class I SAM-dependent methyltransferase [Planctomycetes bacterium]|nr:class I SAM-dependent methyltransferase [Planctomycetota bacterium]
MSRFDDRDRRSFHEQNRRSWNAVTAAHNSHKVDQARFLRDGGSTLFDEERELLGDCAGTRIAHLQCNCGQDTLSIARLGAEVTGVDIADEPIAFARELAAAAGIDATFHRADVFDWLERTEARFDTVFASYGVIGWLCDLGRWARGVARILAPGGRLVLVEFHPLAWSFAAGGRLAEPYFLDGALAESGVNDYVGAELAPSGFTEGAVGFYNPERSFAFQWTIGQTLQAVADAGLRIETFREYPFSNGCELFDGMQRLPGRRFGMPAELPAMPLMFGLAARRDAAGA